MSSDRRRSSRIEPSPPSDTEARARILDAAFEAFTTEGFESASTLDIATRARVSKRALYSLVGNKQEMLLACIQERAQRLRGPVDLPPARDRQSLEQSLVSLGTQLVWELTDATVVAVFRLAIAEAARVPEVARSLDAIGREAVRASLRGVMGEASAAGLLAGPPAELAETFRSLLLGDLIVSRLLGLADRPSRRESRERALRATEAFLQLRSTADAGTGGTRGR